MSISFSVNGTAYEVPNSDGATTLLDFLHDEAHLTGTKLCCGIGVCRACTVIVKKGPTTNPMISCSTPLSALDNTDVQTVEGVAEDGNLSRIQEAFLKHFSFQCGYCAPGFVMAATAFIDQLKVSPISADQLDAAIEDALGEHICRCTGYVRYYEAVKEVALEVMLEKTGVLK